MPLLHGRIQKRWLVFLLSNVWVSTLWVCSGAECGDSVFAHCEVLCRICQDSSGKLVRACGCKGTLAYVHPECLMQWRAYSPKAAAMCELCNCPYTLPGPLGCGQTSALTLTLVALLMIWMSLARDVLVVNGSLLPAAKHCNVGEFTPPWRRALVSLFEAADLDQDGAMSLEEMRALANRTGEKVSDAVLELALKLADHNENLGPSSGT